MVPFLSTCTVSSLSLSLLFFSQKLALSLSHGYIGNFMYAPVNIMHIPKEFRQMYMYPYLLHSFLKKKPTLFLTFLYLQGLSKKRGCCLTSSIDCRYLVKYFSSCRGIYEIVPKDKNHLFYVLEILEMLLFVFEKK